MRDTRLVLIMGGGVSLGTYIAGALTEIFWALQNQAQRGRTGNVAPVRIEVLSGASAGAISAALFARALTTAPAAIADLHRIWVREISIESLLGAEEEGYDPRALLSAREIDRLAAETFYRPADYREWQPFCTSPLRIGITLSNLGGVRFRLDYANEIDTYFSTRIHADHITFELDESEPEAGVWQRIGDAAVASAAFPGAFPPRSIRRRVIDYFPAVFAPELGPEVPMWYVDGGVFDNEPVGLAKDLVEENPSHQQFDYRYILIDPYLAENRVGVNDEVFSEPSSLTRVLATLAAAVHGQSNAKDWIRANKVNWRLAEQRRFVIERLRPLIELAMADQEGIAAQVASGLEDQARSIAHFKRGVNRPFPPLNDEVESYLRANLQRIEDDPRYAEALEGLGDKAREAMLSMIFIVECAAGLRDKEPMPLYLIAPQGDEPYPLAGDFLFNFGGFFREEWREHDFLCGRRDARAVLLEEIRDQESGEPLLDYPPQDGVDYDPAPISVTADDLTKEERGRLRKYLRKRVEPLVRPHLPWYIRPLRGPIVRKVADTALHAIGVPI